MTCLRMIQIGDLFDQIALMLISSVLNNNMKWNDYYQEEVRKIKASITRKKQRKKQRQKEIFAE